MHEVDAVGALIGGGFDITSKLCVMNYQQAMQSMDADGWKHKIDNEHKQIICDEVWEAVEKADLLSDLTVITTTWACKNKANNMLNKYLISIIILQKFQLK